MAAFGKSGAGSSRQLSYSGPSGSCCPARWKPVAACVPNAFLSVYMYAARETLLYQPPEQINSLVSKDLLQQKLVGESEWIMDVDLGSYDAIEVRLRASDTIIFLDFSLVRCAWRAVRRPQERLDFWLWLLRYRRQNRPLLMKAISSYAPHATIHVLRKPEAQAICCRPSSKLRGLTAFSRQLMKQNPRNLRPATCRLVGESSPIP